MTLKHETERLAGYQDFGRLRLENVEACVRHHGLRQNAPTEIIEFAVDRARRSITEGGRSGAHARNVGEDCIDQLMQFRNVVPIGRARRARA